MTQFKEGDRVQCQIGRRPIGTVAEIDDDFYIKIHWDCFDYDSAKAISWNPSQFKLIAENLDSDSLEAP